MSPIYFFVHLAKTGGTTFVGNIYKHLKFDEEFLDLGPHGNNYRAENNRPSLEQRSELDRNKLRIIVGHLVYWEVQELFPNREPRFITFLREPISRVISHYTFDTSKVDKPFKEWYKTWAPNQTYLFYCDHLRENSLEGILRKFKLFWHIGLKENLDSSLIQLYQELGIPTEYTNRRVAGEPENTTKDLGYDGDRKIKQTYIPTEEELNLIRNDHKLDIWLYQHVRESLINNQYKPVDFDIPNDL